MNPNQQWPAMNWPVPDIIAKYLQIASAADGADADRIAACFTEDGQVTDVDEAIRGTAAIREWWQGPATRFRYSMEVLDGHALGNDRYVVFIRLVGNFPGGVADFAERFTVQDGHIAELDIALRAPGSQPVKRRYAEVASPSGSREDRIVERIRAIPEGFVRTYGDIDPVAPRLVGRVLATTHKDLPWHRVVRADGSLPMGAAQLGRLRQEGVPLRGDRVDLAHARMPD